MQKLAQEILSGTYDSDLDTIQILIRQRRDALSFLQLSTMQIGSIVKFTKNVRPKYLQGKKAKVIEKLQKNIVVELESPVGRFSGRIRTSPDLVEP